MASGSAGRPSNSGSKPFNFVSDDILCGPYEDYGNQDGSNGTSHSDPAIGATSAKVDSDIVLGMAFVLFLGFWTGC